MALTENTAVEQKTNGSTNTQIDVMSTEMQATEVVVRFAAHGGLSRKDVDMLIEASEGKLTLDNTVEENIEAESSEETEKDDIVEFDVNGTAVKGKVGDYVSVAPIHLFSGVTLDMGSSQVLIEEPDESGRVTASMSGDGARLILSTRSDTKWHNKAGQEKTFNQILEVAAGDITLSGINKGNKGGDISGLVSGQLAFILPGEGILSASHGLITGKRIVCREDCVLFKEDGSTQRFGRVTIDSEGIMADSNRIESLSLSTEPEKEPAPPSEDTPEPATPAPAAQEPAAPAQSEETPGEASEERKVIDITSFSELTDFGKALLANGKGAFRNVSFVADGEIYNIDDDESQEEILAAFLETGKGAGIDIAKEAGKALLKTKGGIGKRFAQAWLTARTEFVDFVGGAAEVLKDSQKTIDALKDLHIPTGVLQKIQDKLTAASEKTTEMTADFLKVPLSDEDDDGEDKEDDGPGLKAEIKILPGLFSVELSAKPILNLSAGGNMDISKELDSFTFGLNGRGEVGLNLAVAAIVGNSILALSGKIDAEGKLVGALGDNKFFEISGFTITVAGKGKNTTAKVNGSADMDLMVDLEFSLGGAISVGSEIISWEKELVAGRLTSTAATVSFSAKVAKHGKLLSIYGWHLEEGVNLTTAFFDKAKSSAMKVALEKEPNIAGVNDFIREIPERRKKLNDLNNLLAPLRKRINTTSAMVFSKEEDASNKKLVDELEKLMQAYDAQVDLNKIDLGRINNVIADYKELSEVKDPVEASRRSVKKRDIRIARIQEWRDQNKAKLDSGKIGRRRVLDFYEAIAEGAYGYARDDEAFVDKKVRDALFSRAAIIEYETGRLEEKRNTRKSRIEILEEYVKDSKINVNKFSEDFIEKYTDVRGKGKGALHNISKTGIEMGLFQPSTLRKSLLAYEENRALKVSAGEFKTFVDNTESWKKAKKFDKGFNKAAYDDDKPIWKAFVMKYATSGELLAYEKQATNKALDGVFNFNDQTRFRLLSELKTKRNTYNDPKATEESKDKALTSGREMFESYFKSSDKLKEFFDVKNRYKTLSADKMRERIKTLATYDGYIKNTGIGDRITSLEEGDPERVNRELYDSEENMKIYANYVDYLVKEKDYSTNVFSIKKIMDYEKNQKSSDKHAERIEFLQNREKEIDLMNKSFDTEQATTHTKDTVGMYFSGIRPQGYKEKNVKVGKKEKDAQGTIRYNVSVAKAYVEDLKSTPPTSAGMLEALKWEATRQVSRLSIASNQMKDSKASNSVEMYKEWSKTVGKSSADLMNAGLAAVDRDNYGFDEMINYIEFVIGGEKHLNRVDALEDMIDKKMPEDEIKKSYVERLGAGGGFAEAAVDNENLVKQVPLIPSLYLEFAKSQEVKTMIEGRSEKHKARLDKIRAAGDSKESVLELLEWYSGSGATQYDEKLLHTLIVQGDSSKLTPKAIIDFEKNKAEVGSRKHQDRLNAVNATTTDEEARSIYMNEQNKGGAGFESARFKDLDERKEAEVRSRSGYDEIARILEYENKRKEFWADIEIKLMEPVKELEEKKKAIEENIAIAKGQISIINRDLETLRKGTEKLDDAKTAVQTAGNNLVILSKAEETVTKFETLLDETNKEADKKKEELKKIKADMAKELGDGPGVKANGT